MIICHYLQASLDLVRGEIGVELITLQKNDLRHASYI